MGGGGGRAWAEKEYPANAQPPGRGSGAGAWGGVPGSHREQRSSRGSWARILRVALGKHNLQKREATQQVLRVVRQVPHPQYNARTHDNDLLLLRLQQPARLGRAVRPIPVARTCASPQTPCHVSGWGTTSSPIGEDSCTLERSQLGAGLWVRGRRRWWVPTFWGPGVG